MDNTADLRIVQIVDLGAFLTEKAPSDSPFKKERQSELLLGIEDASWKYKLNSVYILAHAILESGWGRSKIAKEKNNLFGYKAFDGSPYESAMSFRSYTYCIDTVMGKILSDYLTPGGKYYNGPTLGGMNKKYASDQEWNGKIRKIMNDIYTFASQRKR